MAETWVGIDNGYSKMTLAVVVEGVHVMALEKTRLPLGDGHHNDVALARLRRLLPCLDRFRYEPVRLAGYCYPHSGVAEEFQKAGWTVEACKALNDVVGFYGLSEMNGHAIVYGCGSYSQVVYINTENAVCWPGDDVDAELPPSLLSGWEYAKFLLELSQGPVGKKEPWLIQEIGERLAGYSLELCGHRWGDLGPLLGRLLDHPEVDDYLSRAAKRTIRTQDVIWQYTKAQEPLRLIFGGGAVQDECLWRLLRDKLWDQGGDVTRVHGEPVVGLARFAHLYPDAEAWAFVGDKRPSWL